MFPGDPLDNRIVSIRTESEAKLGEDLIAKTQRIFVLYLGRIYEQSSKERGTNLAKHFWANLSKCPISN